MISNCMHERILVTGGAGFIGSNFILQQMGDASLSVVNLDKLTYAGNLGNLESISHERRYAFVHADIADRGQVRQALEKHRPSAIVNFAAESHVDRSIEADSDSCRFRPMRYTGRSAPMMRPSRKRQCTHRIAHMRLPKPVPIIWSARTTTLTGCRR